MADSNPVDGPKAVTPSPLRSHTCCPSSARLTRRATSNPQPTRRTSTQRPLSSPPLTPRCPSFSVRSNPPDTKTQAADESIGQHVGQGTVWLRREGGPAARQHSPQAYALPYTERNNLMTNENVKLKTRITVLEK